jgi:HlyD family secretion protein
MKRLILILLLAAAAAGLWFFYFRPRAAGPAGPPGELHISGNIEAHSSVLSFKVGGRIVKLLAEEGQSVAAGQALAELEMKDFRQQAALDESAIRVREAELKLARAGSRRQEMESAEQAVRDAEADLEQRKLDFDRAEQLWRRDAGTKQSRDAAETAVKRATAALARAREQRDLLREGTRKEQIAIAEANLAQARERLGLSRLNLEHAVLRAPTAGVVLVRQAELGEVVVPGTPVLTLADLERVWLRAYVPESDLGRVRWGQEARISTDTYPGKIYHGRITFIASEAEFTPKNVETRAERVKLVYRVKIDVENPNHELKPGMPADAVITLGAGPQSP